jgi:hypothetical protein
MKKIKIITLAFIISIILIGNAFSQEPNKSSWSNRQGPKIYNHGGQMRFLYVYLSIQNWRNYWSVSNLCSNYINDQIRFIKQTGSRLNHSAEGWFWTTLPKNETHILILGFADLDPRGGSLAWVAVKNCHDGLYITSAQRSNWNRIEDYPYSKASFPWTVFGRIIKIEVQDPQNINGWNQNDIWYRFSH